MGVLHRSYIGEAAELQGVRDPVLMKEDSGSPPQHPICFLPSIVLDHPVACYGRTLLPFVGAAGMPQTQLGIVGFAEGR